MKKITAIVSTAAGLFAALPAFAQLPRTVNQGLAYSTIVGWGTQDLRTTIMLVINIIMGFLGIIAVIIVLTGGFKWMTAGGNEEKVAEAKKLIIAGVIGLAIIFGAYAIASFVIQQLATATGA
ncbi:MAG: hypothetical protein PHI63_05970 [Patescibacteria group bacterium]|nr:hypothetical protein [Patescibacteria group bacterium]